MLITGTKIIINTQIRGAIHNQTGISVAYSKVGAMSWYANNCGLVPELRRLQGKPSRFVTAVNIPSHTDHPAR